MARDMPPRMAQEVGGSKIMAGDGFEPWEAQKSWFLLGLCMVFSSRNGSRRENAPIYLEVKMWAILGDISQAIMTHPPGPVRSRPSSALTHPDMTAPRPQGYTKILGGLSLPSQAYF